MNSIVVSPQARSLLDRRFEVEDTDLVDSAGTRALRVLGYQPHRFGPRDHGAPLVGRQVQLAALRGRWDEASRGRGQIIALIGEPGIGKSRLLSVSRIRRQSPSPSLGYAACTTSNGMRQ